MMLLELILLLVFLGLIILFSELTTKAAVRLSNVLGTSYATMGFIMVAISTTQPELFVGIESVARHISSLSIANILGSCIANIGLIFGLIGVIYGFKISSDELKKNSIFIFMISSIPLIFLITNRLTIFDGLVLIGIFGYYIYSLLKEDVSLSAMLPFHEHKMERRPWGLRKWQIILKSSAMFAVGIGGTLICADQIVGKAIVLISELGISPVFIGGTIIAIGTSLPELIINLQAMARGYRSMAFGGLIGACAVDLSLVLGVTTLVGGGVSIGGMLPMVAVLLLINLIFIQGLLRHGGINKKYGMLMLIMFAVFLIWQVSTLA